MNKTEAINLYLAKNSPLAKLYTPEMEVQVNTAKGTGNRIETGSFKGRTWVEWTDGIETWKSFRIPAQAMSDPINNDGAMTYDFDKHVEAIGLTGWNWVQRKSVYVAFDFDAMLGHSDTHSKRLTNEQLIEIRDVITRLDYVTLYHSTSGRGLHLYVFFDEPVVTQNHTEHAALARAILNVIAGQTGYNFSDKVDVCGGMMWVWHRKMLGTNGLTAIKEGRPFPTNLIPPNWQEHIPVITRRAVKVASIEELCVQRSRITLDAEHLKLITYLTNNQLMHWWDSDNHRLITHTAYLRTAHEALKLRGEFHTISTGSEYGHDHNCFLFPLRGGSWVVRRYGIKTAEHHLWDQDQKGYTKCYFNRELTLGDLARLGEAVETESSYNFPNSGRACELLLKVGITLEIPEWIRVRQMKIKEVQGRFMLGIPKEESDQAGDMRGWAIERGYYRRLVTNFKNPIEDENLFGEYDDIVRHIVDDTTDLGWVVNIDNSWRSEPVAHAKLLLKSRGLSAKEIDLILGNSVSRAWLVVNKPFYPEYPGDRQWNRSRAQFKVPPTIEGESVSHPTWDRVFEHVGRSLDAPILENEWCQVNGIKRGSEYLLLWFASMIKHPDKPLPYLGFFGPQDSGKSTIHEAFCQLILSGGYIRADNALTNSSGFNGELEGCVFAIIEETNLNSNKNTYNRLKDWVTSSQIAIHTKGMTPRMASNYIHFVQCANSPTHIPVFQGDKRVVLISVDSIPEEQLIPKRDLWTLLTKEASDFLATLLSLDIPDSRDRLMLPVITTSSKKEMEYESLNPVERFIEDCTFPVPGAYISSGELYTRFLEYMSATDIGEASGWTRNKFGREMPKSILKGRISKTKTQDTYYGNISFNAEQEPSTPLAKIGDFLTQKVDYVPRPNS